MDREQEDKFTQEGRLITGGQTFLYGPPIFALIFYTLLLILAYV